MSWGRLKPFWQSKAWKKSADRGTGVFSWGGSDLAKGLDLYVPGMGTGLDTFLDKLSASEKTRLAGTTNSSMLPSSQAISTASFIANNQTLVYVLGALVVYKVFLK